MSKGHHFLCFSGGFDQAVVVEVAAQSMVGKLLTVGYNKQACSGNDTLSLLTYKNDRFLVHSEPPVNRLSFAF